MRCLRMCVLSLAAMSPRRPGAVLRRALKVPETCRKRARFDWRMRAAARKPQPIQRIERTVRTGGPVTRTGAQAPDRRGARTSSRCLPQCPSVPGRRSERPLGGAGRRDGGTDRRLPIRIHASALADGADHHRPHRRRGAHDRGRARLCQNARHSTFLRRLRCYRSPGLSLPTPPDATPKPSPKCV